ncbi:VOC family protein [Pelagibacterium flavum]|uniref:VOC family protein n=1 Tax=Pelagibacterium flavum TaxID=2984530 RepID=A0ABY6ILA6_9HYPH|nr:VOC family protein [Pelagibacterium sp. YIM 151497]MAN75643.1 glyoxalase [Hyphomicrobiales bacterium]UYQ71363.1 VOC family protein [Pelagibacterium sp. YIM 151497]|tara:strand:+ start:3940 stop:4323 length:384 start_codon:yes stop_codon:yes gene_type:complete
MAHLKDKVSSAIIAVGDIERARKFYSETLGLELEEDGMGGVLVYKTGSTRLLVYPSDFAGTNKANAVVFDCGGDIEGIVESLRGKGVTFEHYPDMGLDFENGIHSSGDFKMVWFKDPDGNILHLNSA